MPVRVVVNVRLVRSGSSDDEPVGRSWSVAALLEATMQRKDRVSLQSYELHACLRCKGMFASYLLVLCLM